MTNNEKQIEELQDILINNGVFNNLVCRQDYAYPDALISDLCYKTAEIIYGNGYRKLDTTPTMTAEEHKLDEAIKQDGIETQSDILEELKRRYPQYVEDSHNEQETVIDAQIEQAEKSLKWVVNQIPDNLGDSNEEKMLKCIKRYCESGAEAINRLKRDMERIKKNCNTAVSVQRAIWKAKVKHAGKDTAKEILQDWYDDTKVRQGEDGKYIINYAKKYGVEIDQ